MATRSGASSSAGSPGGSSRPSGQPLCPFCKTATIVLRTSRTEKHPDKPFYTCRNRDWGSSKCSFFMWKPESEGGDAGHGDAAAVVAGLQSLENSLLDLQNAVRSIGADQRVNWWMSVASVFVGVVSFVVLCIIMCNQA